MHYDTGLYSDGCEEKIAIDEAVFWSTIAATPHLSNAVELQKVTFKMPQNSERV